MNRQTKLKIKPHLKRQGSKRKSVLLSQGHAQEEELCSLLYAKIIIFDLC